MFNIFFNNNWKIILIIFEVKMQVISKLKQSCDKSLWLEPNGFQCKILLH